MTLDAYSLAETIAELHHLGVVRLQWSGRPRTESPWTCTVSLDDGGAVAASGDTLTGAVAAVYSRLLVRWQERQAAQQGQLALAVLDHVSRESTP